MRKILAGLIVLASVVIVVSFFMPWARVSVSAVGVSKELTTAAEGKLKDTPIAGKLINRLKAATGAISEIGDIAVRSTVYGYKIPEMANSKTSKVALAAVQIISKETEGLDKKSYLVYLFPILGIICGILALSGLKSKIYVAIMLIISGIVGIGGFYNLSTAKLAETAVKIDIMNGLWNTIYAFLVIFVMGILWLIDGKKE